MKRIRLGMGLAALGVAIAGCGGPEKPPLMPDGPLETMPAGSDGGETPITPTAATTVAPAAVATPATPAKK